MFCILGHAESILEATSFDFGGFGAPNATHELTNSVGLEAVLEAGALHGVSGSIQHFLSGRVGIVRVYVDDLEAPVLTVPLDMRAVLSARSQNAWVGVTASTGEDFATFDVHNLKFWR